MKSIPISFVILTYINIFIIFTPSVNSENNELEIYKNVFNNGVLKQIAEYLNETNQFDRTNCTKDIAIWSSVFLSKKHLWPFQSK